MLILLSIIFNSILFSLILWGSIKILDPYNSKNSYGLALFLGAFFSVFSGLGGYILALLPLFALMSLLLKYYDLGVGRSLIILTLFFLINLGLNFLISAILGG